MKKSLLLIAIVMMAVAVNAQTFAIGPKVGYQTQTLSASGADVESGFKNNFTAGLFTRFGISKFIIQPEILYFRTGQVFNMDIDGFSPKLTLNRVNIGVPVMLGYKFIDLKVFKMRATVGPVFNFAVSQDNDKEGFPDNIDVEKITGKDFSVNGMVSLGFDVLFLTVDVGYSFGLSNIMGDQTIKINGYDVAVEESRQNMFMVTIGAKLFSL